MTRYRYRPDGLRLCKEKADGSETSHIWDGSEMVAEYQSNGTVIARYLRGINLIARELDGRQEYYLHNAHGDVVQRTDRYGTPLKSYDYDAFGNEEKPEELDHNPWRYCGEYLDLEVQNYYLRARSYEPRTGRFTTEDIVHDGLNWYTYCGNNPVMLIDPSGQSWKSFWSDARDWAKGFMDSSIKRMKNIKDPISLLDWLTYGTISANEARGRKCWILPIGIP
ncbi:RHS repeat-associated core domain-containing protein [Harryflintia acetispora]|uniref:RHS repeat-associated protein n=1 Tax=Harryflintia acetispora TaxID=1849041 RepID=A0A9X8Y7F6_9FIRM|nr:RHS repeat-associated core domain-containing protein [Harryflintia acetispora]TCL41921.1 RHS repeat-associated protein [Harryflintia acetispora]